MLKVPSDFNLSDELREELIDFMMPHLIDMNSIDYVVEENLTFGIKGLIHMTTQELIEEFDIVLGGEESFDEDSTIVVMAKITKALNTFLFEKEVLNEQGNNTVDTNNN